MPVMEGLTALKVATAEYDFTVDTGAIAAYTLRGVGVNGGAIPNGSIITGGEVEILTAFTTGTAATMAISIEGANDLVSATVVSGAPYSTTGQKSIIPVGTGATMIKTTAARQIVATIATGTVTAGKLRVRLTYI